MDTIEQRKAALIESSNQHKEAVKAKIGAVGDSAERTATDAMIVAGLLGGGVLIYKLLKKRKKGNQLLSLGFQGRLSAVVKQQAALLVLNEGRKMLVRYIDQLDE